MNSKKWIKIFVVFSFFGVLFVGGVNYVVDPFHQYRVNTFYKIAYDGGKQRYKNSGFSKNFRYDSLILGTSMTENFIINEVEKTMAYEKVIKLSVSGGSAREQSLTLNNAINNNNQLKNVLWGIDTFAFVGEPSRYRFGPNSFPKYLYDDKRINDYKYILSVDTLKESLKALLNQYRINDPVFFNYNKMYQWQHKTNDQFNIKSINKAWLQREKQINYEKDKQTYSYLKNSFDKNFYNIIAKNIDINFNIFFPTYSILYFKSNEEANRFNDILKFKKYLYNVLLEFPNVKLYDFQIEKKITHDLSNYKDLSHYHQKINTWMLKQIKENNYLVTKENIDQHLENLRKQVKDYDLNKTF